MSDVKLDLRDGSGRIWIDGQEVRQCTGVRVRMSTAYMRPVVTIRIRPDTVTVNAKDAEVRE